LGGPRFCLDSSLGSFDFQFEFLQAAQKTNEKFRKKKIFRRFGGLKILKRHIRKESGNIFRVFCAKKKENVTEQQQLAVM
jgi:hypothetical protein